MVDLTPAAQRLADLVAGVSDGQLAGPTPCPAYTVGDLVEHVGGLARAFRAAAEKDLASPYVNGAPAGDAARLEEGWRDRIPADLAALARAWADPDAWTGMTRIANMDAPAEAVGVTVADELVVHGWDVARATGQPVRDRAGDAGRGAGVPGHVRQPGRARGPGSRVRAVP